MVFEEKKLNHKRIWENKQIHTLDIYDSNFSKIPKQIDLDILGWPSFHAFLKLFYFEQFDTSITL